MVNQLNTCSTKYIFFRAEIESLLQSALEILPNGMPARKRASPTHGKSPFHADRLTGVERTALPITFDQRDREDNSGIVSFPIDLHGDALDPFGKRVGDLEGQSRKAANVQRLSLEALQRFLRLFFWPR